MTRCIHGAVTAALLSLSLHAGAAEPNPLLANVISALPSVPLVIQGDMLKRDDKGDKVAGYPVEMVLDWKADIPTARYTVRDSFGKSLQHMAITWNTPGEPEYRYLEGSPLQAAPLPPLNRPILDTDITWLDLSLSFLWWQGGMYRGQEKIRGRPCDIIDVPAPEGRVQLMDGVRLWVDEKAGVILRAEGYNRGGERTRRMDIKSFKKINGQWVIKDIEFKSYPAGTRTSLKVRDVIERERFELPDRDSRGGFTDTVLPVPAEPDAASAADDGGP